MNRIKLTLAAAVLAAAAAAPAHAVLLNFDSLASGAPANADPGAIAGGVTFFDAEYTASLDGFGDPIPGSERWRPITVQPETILARDPATVAWGPAPSPANALDARFSQVLMHFDAPATIFGFSFALDNSTFGTLGTSEALFLDAAGNTLGTVSFDQSIAGGFYAYAGAPLAGVADVLLPAGAFYDNVVATVPEPSTWALLGAGLAVLAGVARRRRPIA